MGVHIEAPYAQVAVAMSLTGDAEVMYCTYGISVDAFDQDSVDELHNTAASDWADLLIDEYDVLQHIVTTETAVWESTGGAVAGTQDPPSLPQNSAYLVKKNTGKRGRSKRGRMYLPGPQEAAVGNNGVLGSGVAASVQATIDAYFVSVLGVTGITGLYLLHTLASEDPDPIVSFTVDSMIATQRRRLR